MFRSIMRFSEPRFWFCGGLERRWISCVHCVHVLVRLKSTTAQKTRTAHRLSKPPRIQKLRT